MRRSSVLACPPDWPCALLAPLLAVAFHVEMFTLWDDEAAIRRFAGDDLLKAKYYDFDPDFLLELEPQVTHFIVNEG